MILCGIVLPILLLLWIKWRRGHTRNIRNVLLILIAASALGLILGINERQNPVLTKENTVRRNLNGEGSYQGQFSLKAEGLFEEYTYEVEIPEQALNKAEEEELLKAAEKEIACEFPGENDSVNSIRNRVVIRESYQDGKVRAEWAFDNYNIMDMEGNVIGVDLSEEGVLVEAAAELSCGDLTCQYRFYFRVYPRILNKQERFFEALGEYLNKEKSKRGEEHITLPEEILGYPVTWEVKKEYLPEKILFMGCILAVMIPILENSKRQELKKKREYELILEYPDIVSKLALLLGAGMTLAGAWKKIALSYSEKQKSHLSDLRPAYEEMLTTWHEMESGAGEERAYEKFGERCGQQRYRRLGNILTQNLKRGNKGMIALLEAEADNAFEERKSMAKKYGEEAGTKLLLPMMIMLGIVMLILIVPAVLSFQM